MAPPPANLVSHLILLLLLSNVAVGDLAGDTDSLLALRAAVGGRPALPWNRSISACSWPGIMCEGGRVVVLRLPGAGLSGQIPPSTVGNLAALRTLSFRFNSLTGTLPSDIGNLVELRNLYLQGNHLSGPLPETLYGLKNLVRLNIAGNNFSGEISPSLSNFSRLATLYIDGNGFSGKIPELNLPSLQQFNVSFNKLSGSIPMNLRSWPRSAFLEMQLCGGPMGPCPGEAVPSQSPVSTPESSTSSELPASHHHKNLSGGAIAGIVIGSVVAALIILAILLLCCHQKRTATAGSVPKPFTEAKGTEPILTSTAAMDKGLANGAPVAHNGTMAAAPPAATAKKLTFFNHSAAAVAPEGASEGGRGMLVGLGAGFDLEDLLRASAEVLGKGTFGTTYKAVLESGVAVAVKRLKDVDLVEAEFRERISKVGELNHKNIVPLLAYYYSRDEKLLVYEYMSMGSLSALLHGNRGSGRTPLNWETRSTVALTAARGIEYIHLAGPLVSHGNIKSSNILLTKSNEACVADHGLCTLIGPTFSPTRVSGYRAPEVTDPRKVSQKADVYSFGVLLLELLTGKAPSQALLNDEGVDLPRWVQSVVREEWTTEVFDLELLRYDNVEEEMVQLLQLAIDCSSQHPDKRPSMSEVVPRIEEILRSTLETTAGSHEKQIDQTSSN